jgi:hypothetical protein
MQTALLPSGAPEVAISTLADLLKTAGLAIQLTPLNTMAGAIPTQTGQPSRVKFETFQPTAGWNPCSFCP